mmetsp:Transcript_4433/g.6587  ORF Transcript_4433/g.6587 Transcript_4433/m.6587 type:complete len:153 (-) Transcript_4433:189-647(-)
MWSVGVIIFVLLVGYPPFMEEKQSDLFRKIRTGDYEFYEDDWDKISDEAIDLIKQLLVLDPTHRLTADEALQSPWFEECDTNTLSNKDLADSIRALKQRRKRLRCGNTALMWSPVNPMADPVPHPHCPHKDTLQDESDHTRHDEEDNNLMVV